ncbi:Homeobox protein OTX2 [Termitomyces sp. T112]|nr:Homeobox protein OTX2 [Termitomyces sp. T112]
MSQSRSTTPTPNTFSTNFNPSSDSTTSRIPPNAHLFETTIAEGDQPQFSHSTQVYHLPVLSQSTPSGSTHRRMTRRLQRKQDSSRPAAQSSTSNSQKDAAGTSKGDEPLQPAAPLTKKKRTRTLTTPHQAAVLHALLAKSRFPNTAVREEVGRSIGLSARKVQVWFQNQRQKQRHSQSDMSHNKPLQIGVLSSGSEISTLGSFPLASEPSSTTTQMGRLAAREYYSLNPSSDWDKSSSELSGPGMPGPEPSSDLTYRGRRAIPSRPSTAHEGFMRYNDLRDQSRRSPSPVRLYTPSSASHTAILERPYELDRSDPSRTLPPLIFLSAPPRSNFSVPGPYSEPFDAADTERQSLSPLFPHQPPETVRPVTWPPYIVQPQPQVPTSSFHSTPGLSRSPSYGSTSRSLSPSVPATERPSATAVIMNENDQPVEVRPLKRPGRYDPIRGTFIYSSPPDDDHQATRSKM